MLCAAVGPLWKFCTISMIINLPYFQENCATHTTIQVQVLHLHFSFKGLIQVYMQATIAFVVPPSAICFSTIINSFRWLMLLIFNRLYGFIVASFPHAG